LKFDTKIFKKLKVDMWEKFWML